MPLAIKLVIPVANNMTEIELTGINIAAISGDRFPDTAKLIPTILYKNEMTKLDRIIFMAVLEKCK